MTHNKIHSLLIERNSNFRRFAIAHGYNPRNVLQVVARYAGTGRKPRSVLTYKILDDLSIAIGEPVIDGLGIQIENPDEQGASNVSPVD